MEIVGVGSRNMTYILHDNKYAFLRYTKQIVNTCGLAMCVIASANMCLSYNHYSDCTGLQVRVALFVGCILYCPSPYLCFGRESLVWTTIECVSYQMYCSTYSFMSDVEPCK